MVFFYDAVVFFGFLNNVAKAFVTRATNPHEDEGFRQVGKGVFFLKEQSYYKFVV